MPPPTPIDSHTDALVDAVLSGNPLARGPFRAEVKKALDDRAGSRSLRGCTALLQGLDWMVRKEIDRELVRQEPSMDSPLWSDWRANLAKLVYFEQAMRRLRARRRQAAHDLLVDLERTGYLSEFAHAAIGPLVGRPWLPNLVHEHSGLADLNPVRDGSWMHPGTESVLRELSLEQHGSDGLQQVLNALERRDDLPAMSATVAYLRAALLVHSSVVPQPAVSAPVLFTPQSESWPVGHLLDVLVMPRAALESSMVGRQNAADTGTLRQLSLVPARIIVRELLSGDEGAQAELDALGGHVAVGDYPGGAHMPPEMEGSSAGMVLAAALWARVCGLALDPRMLATARIDTERRDAPFQALDDPAGLRRKGRVAALSGCNGVAVAGASDGAVSDDARHLQAGASSVGIELSVMSISALADVDGLLLTDPYAAMLDRLVADDL